MVKKMSSLSDLLAAFGVPALSKAMGRNLTESLEIVGQSPTATNLAIALEISMGPEVLRDRAIRAAAIEYLGPEAASRALNLTPPSSRELREDWYARAANFVWGDNQKTRNLIDAISSRTGMSPDELLPKASTPLETTKHLAPDIALHDYQDRLRRDSIAILNSGAMRLVIHMPTGSGKTRTTMELISDLTRQTPKGFGIVIWLAHSDELCEQAIESFTFIWGKKGTHSVEVVRLWGGRTIEQIPNEAFVVTSFRTAYEMLRTGSDSRAEIFFNLRRSCSFLVVDEAHQATAPTYRDAIDLLANQRTKIIGLTATPGRHHLEGDVEETDELARFFHRKRLAIRSPMKNEGTIEYLQRIRVLSKIKVEELHYDANLILTDSERLAVSNLLDVPDSVLKKLAEQRQRTAAIVGQIQQVAVIEKHQTIVFATAKEHSDEIALLLQLSGCEARSVTSGTPQRARQEAITDFRKGVVRVLVNFGVLTTGFDAPNTTCVLIARPTTSVVLYSQMIGRGIRGELMGGTEQCLIVDVKDNIYGMPELPKAFSFFDASWR